MTRNYYYTESNCYLDRDGREVPIPISNNRLIETMFAHLLKRIPRFELTRYPTEMIMSRL